MENQIKLLNQDQINILAKIIKKEMSATEDRRDYRKLSKILYALTGKVDIIYYYW